MKLQFTVGRGLFLNRVGRHAVLALAATSAAASLVGAQTLNWSNSGIGTAAGGTGIWDASSMRWFDGSVYVAWPNNTSTNAVFGGAGGLVQVESTGVSANSLTFTSDYVLSRPGVNAGTITTSAATITLGGGTINTGANRVEIFNELATSSGLTKDGPGTLITHSASAAATFVGPITINAGTLAIGNTLIAGFPNATSMTIAAGATFDFGIYGGAYSDTFGSLNGAGNVRLQSQPGFGIATGSTLGIGADNGNGIFSGVIGGAGGRLTKSGTGIATLQGTNTFTGITQVTGGTLVLDVAGNISDQSGVFLSGTSTLTLNASKTLGSLANGSATTIVDMGANNLTLGTDNRFTQFTGVLAGSGRLTKLGTGIQVFATTASTWTGGVTVQGGEFIASSDTRFGTAPGAFDDDSITLDGGGIGNFANTGFTINANRGITITSNNGTIRASDKTATVTYGGVITGAGRLTKIGPGTLALTTNNETYTGGTAVNDGTLSLSQTAGQALGTGDVSVSSATLAVLPAAIAGDPAISLADGAASNKFTYGKGTNLIVGRNTNNSITLQIGNAAAAANSAFVRGTGGTLVLTPTNGIAELGGTGANFIKVLVNGGMPTNVNGGTPASDGDMVSASMISATGIDDLAGEFLRYDASNGLAKATYSTITDINSATANTVYDAGTGANTNTLSADVTAYAVNARNQTIGGSAILTVGTGTAPAGVILSGGTISTTALNFGSREAVIYAGGGTPTASFVNSITANIQGTGGLTKVGGAVLTVSGTSSVTGGINAMGGTLQLGGSNVFDSSNALLIGHRGAIDLNGNAQTVASLSSTGTGSGTVNLGSGGTLTVGAGTSHYRGHVTGSNGSMLVKDGAGVLTLGEIRHLGAVPSAASSYQRLTIKNGGVVAISASASLPPSLASASALADTITLDNGTLQINGVSQTLINSASTFTLASGATAQRGLTLGSGGGTIEVTDPLEIVFLQVDNATARNIVSGSGDLRKTGDGFLRLGPGNTYTGKTIVLGGALQIQLDDTLGQAPGGYVDDQLQIGNGAMLQSSNTGSLSPNRGIKLLAGGALVNTSTGNFQFNAPVIGVGGLTKVGSGASILQLNAANTFAGNLEIQNGTVALNVTGAAGNGSLVLNPLFPVGISKATAGDAVISNAVQMQPGSSIDMNVTGTAGVLELSGAIGGNASRFFKTGNGTLLFSNSTNSYTGTTVVTAGILKVGTNNALGSTAGATLVQSGASLMLDGGVSYTTPEPTAIAGSGVSGAGAINSVSGNNTYAGPVALAQSSTVNVGADTLTLSAGVRGASDLTVSGGGTLAVGGVRVSTLNVNNPRVEITAGRSSSKTSQISTLNLGSGTLDLNDNDLVVGNTTAAAVRAQLISGQITSTVAASQANRDLGSAQASEVLGAVYPVPFSGVQVQSGSDVVVRYTYRGDANLNGQVDSVDFNALAAAYGATSGGVWKDGDFNYDDKINTLDFNYLAGNFNATPIPSALPGATIGSVVPEPGSLSLIALGIAGLAARRRR